MTSSNQKNIVFLSGNEAVAWGARAAGVCFASAYPGTPSTEILETLAGFKELEAQWAVNEKVAFEAAFGACIGGKRALSACKHVGLNLAMDPLMTTAYSGVNAGFVVVVADDPGMHSSQNEQDSRRVAPFAKIPLIEPSSPSEAYRYIQEAYKISEQFDVPVLFRITTRISHTKESFEMKFSRQEISRPLAKDITKYVMVPGHARARHVDLEKRLARLQEYSEKTFLNHEEIKDKKIGFISSSVAALYTKEIYPNASHLTLGMSFPLPIKKIKAFAKKVEKLYVIEELEPFLEEQLKQEGIRVIAKKPSWRCGELKVEAVRQIVAKKERQDNPSKARRPVLCPGCPHRPAFYALKNSRFYVAGDIGCYTLGAMEPLAALHTQICMGASIPFFEGIGKTNPQQKVVAVIGDSTFIHTGINGLISAAYNNAKGVVVIMDNATTAMTGAQENPSTGVTLQGKKAKKLILEDICKAAGADSVDVIDPNNLKAFENLLKTRVAQDQLSVIIARSPCKIIDPSRKPALTIDRQLCKDCGLCLKLDCPAIIRADNGSLKIDQFLCTGCGVCLQVCNLHAILENPAGSSEKK